MSAAQVGDEDGAAAVEDSKTVDSLVSILTNDTVTLANSVLVAAQRKLTVSATRPVVVLDAKSWTGSFDSNTGPPTLAAPAVAVPETPEDFSNSDRPESKRVCVEKSTVLVAAVTVVFVPAAAVSDAVHPLIKALDP